MVASKRTIKSLESISSRLQLVTRAELPAVSDPTVQDNTGHPHQQLPGMRKSETEYYAISPQTGVHHLQRQLYRIEHSMKKILQNVHSF